MQGACSQSPVCASSSTISRRSVMTRTWKKKPWYKPPKWYKVIMRRIRRAKENTALRDNRDIPRFRKTDTWDWS